MLTAARTYGAELGRSRSRQAGLVLLAAVHLYVVAQAGDAQTFLRFFVLGVADGCVLAVAATGLVLTYTTTGVFNFAHGAVGMVSAYAYYTLRVDAGVPAPLAVAAVLVVLAPAVGLVLELVMRPFRDAPATTSIVVTVALTVLLIGAIQVLYPTTGAGRPVPALFGDRTVSVLGARVAWDKAAFLVVGVGMAFALRALLFRTRTGTAMRAVVDDPALAALNGAPTTRIARTSWVTGAVLAALSGVLLAGGTGLEPVNLTFAIVASYGAAVCGGLRSLPLTVAGAVLLGLLRNYALFALPEGSGWQRLGTSLPGLFLLAALLFLPESRLRRGRSTGRRPPAVPGGGATVVRAAAFVAVVVAAANVAPADYLPDLTRGVIYGVVALSLVVLTGFSGQVSLCQYVFVALGAWAMGSWFGGHSVLGMLAAGLVAIPAGILVALPAMRLQGLYLALATIGVAIFSRELVLRDDRIFGVAPVEVGRLRVVGVDFSSNEAFLVLCAVVFAVLAVAILALRRGPFGRRLAAMGDSQVACATLGLDVRRTKLVVFGLSAFVAGVAGSLLGGLNAFVSEIQFEPVNNVVLLLFAAVGGITTVTGALLGGMLFALLPLVQSEQPELAGLVFAAVAAGAIGLGRQPNGLAGLLYESVRRPGGVRPRWPARIPSRAAGASAAAVALVACTVLAAAEPAAAQSDRAAEQFGGFELLARGNGLQVTYDSPGLVPHGPAFQASIPEALATSSSGTNYALASLAYPGPVLADLSTVLAQSNPDLPAVVPPYPVRTQAFFPSGPTAQVQSGGSAEMRSVTDAESSQAVAFYAGTDVGPLVRSGAVRSHSSTQVEDGRVVSRARVEVQGVDLLGGLVHVDSVITDLVAVSDGDRAATDGRTTVAGMTVLGLAATVDGDGLHVVDEPPGDRPPGPLDPLLDPLVGSGTVPPGSTDEVQPLLDGLNGVVASLGPGATLADALEKAGVTMRVLDPVATADGATATRSAYGLQVEIDYAASGDPVLGPFLAQLHPPGSLPGDCPVPGAPVDCSPEGLVSLLTRTHIGGLGIGAADVRAAATAPFEPLATSLAPPAPLPPGRGVDGPLAGAGDVPAGFTTPVPPLAGGGAGGLGAGTPLSALGRAVPAVLVVLLLLSAPLWAVGSRRLADAALADRGPACPDATQPFPPPGRR